MGFLKGAWDAAKGSLGAGFANQWLEYMTVPQGFDGQALVGRAMPMKKEGSANNDGQEDAFIISDGSRFEVPENTALILVENGGITAVVAEPGRYTYTTQDVPEAKSFFVGDGFFASTFGQSLEQFKFGGQPSNKQLAFYVNLRPIAGLQYGTRTPVVYDDAKYGGIQMAVVSHGTYTVKVVDPILLIKNAVTPDFFTGTTSKTVFSLADTGKDGGSIEDALFNGFIGSLSTALSKFCAGGKSIPDIQGGLEDFAADVDEAVEQKHHWGTLYGLSVIDVQPAVIEWDEESQKTVDEFRKTAMQGQAQAMAMGAIGQAMAQDGGAVGAAYSQATIAQGFKAAGENQSGNGGATGMFGMGMAINQMGGAGGLVTPVGGGAAAAPAPAAPAPAAPAAAPAAETPAEPATPEAPAAPETPEAPATETPETPAAQ